MISAILLLTIAAIDIVIGLAKLRRPTSPAAGSLAARWAACVVAVALPVAGAVFVATPPAWAAAIALYGLVWLWAESRFLRGRGHTTFLTAAILAVTVVAVAVVSERPTDGDAAAARAFASYTTGAGLPVSLSLALAAAAAALILTRTANVVCRAAFGRTVTSDEPVDLQPERRWSITFRSREVGSVVEAAQPCEPVGVVDTAAPAAALRGGRVIGPLERILIVALALVGAEAVIVGLLAAKGIVRFPEISADGRRGSKAEEFLVGSLVSWTMAGLMAAYLKVQRIT
ncbi:hypothetical protein [Leifsonia sp. 2MCAF36]|uniref:hypothetical protein n=1 Tax=Leifsonia sp. 2MCAF36 TaxID=3232988 RepID=UPI003F9824BF